MNLTKLIFLFTLSLFFNSRSHAQRNPNNPYDRVGELHNYLLDAFFTEQTKESVAGRWSQETLSDYVCRKIPDINCPFVHQVMSDKLITEIKDKTLLQSESIFLDHGFVHARHEYYVQQINDIIESHFEEEYLVSYKSVLRLEDQLVNDPDLTPSEIINLLCSSSVARYSIKFWKDVAGGLARYPSIANDMTNLACCSWLKNISQADVRGAIAGGIVGGTAGSSGGGIGGLPASGGGSVIAGGCSSIASGVASLWHCFF